MYTYYKTLLLDIERAPYVATVWALRDQYIHHNQLTGDSETLTWSAKWVGSPRILTGSLLRDGKRPMLQAMHDLIQEADMLVTWNGDNFDLRVIAKDFLHIGMKPPAPAKSVDLLRVVKRRFLLPSYKLDYVAQYFGVGKKLEHRGHQMWLDCMARSPKAFVEMLAYNKHDVVLLEGIYLKVLPWIDRHPNLSVALGELCCPNCGSKKAQRRGVARNARATYARLQCMDCGRWYRSQEVVDRVRTDAAVGL